MKNKNQKKVTYAPDFDFDDAAVYDLDQKLFNGEITFEEYKEKVHALIEEDVWFNFLFLTRFYFSLFLFFIYLSIISYFYLFLPIFSFLSFKSF